MATTPKADPGGVPKVFFTILLWGVVVFVIVGVMATGALMSTVGKGESPAPSGREGSTIILSLPVPGPAPAPKPAVAGKPTLRVSPESASVRQTQDIRHIPNAAEWTKFRAFYDPDGPEGPSPETEVTFSAKWEASNPETVHLNATGAFYGKGVFASTAPGETTITSSYQGLSAEAGLRVIP